MGCSPQPPNSYRDYFYSGMSSFCANLHSIDNCTKSIQGAIINKQYESITPLFTSPRDSFYFGMNIDCIKYEKYTQKDCSKSINQSMKDKYFEQLGIPKTYPTSQGEPEG